MNKHIHAVKVAAIACALCLTVGVMRSVVLAKDRDAAAAPAPVSSEATFVVLDWNGADSGEPQAALLEANAVITPEITDNRTSVPYFVNGTEAGVCWILDGELCVDAEEFCQDLGLAVTGALMSDRYTLSGDGLSLEARTGDLYCVCNGRCLLAETGLQQREGKALLPLETMAKCLGVKATWDRASWMVTVRADKVLPLESGDSYYQETDVYWLSRMIYAEAGNQSFTGQLAVGDVVVNRLDSENYPGQNNIYDVIFAKNQFDVVINGMIYMEPDESSVVAAKLALEGYDVVSGATVFDTSELEGYDCVARIGDYCFMRSA